MGIFDFLLGKKESKSSEGIKSNTTKNGVPFTNEVERELYENNTFGYRDRKDNLDYQNALLSRVNKAQAKYKQDGDLEAVIKELEYAFIESNPPCSTSQNLDLADYYIKAGQYDKAWGYLNHLYRYQQAPINKIRFAQAKVLKKEKKWSYAIEMYMLGYLAKSEWNNTFQKEMFVKDIKSCVNKLNWDEDKVEYLCYLIEIQVKQRDYSESRLTESYRKFCSDNYVE